MLGARDSGKLQIEKLRIQNCELEMARGMRDSAIRKRQLGLGGNRRQSDGFERFQVEFLRGVFYINADDVALGVEVGDQPVGDFARVGAGPGIQVDVEGIGFRVIVELHLISYDSLMVT